MKPAKLVLLLVLVTALPTSLSAKEVSEIDRDLGASYLSQWFSIDTAEPINLSLTPIEDVSAQDRVKLSFTSDDGQVVNGIIAYPNGNVAANKLALALHPMGSDQDFWWNEESSMRAFELTAKLRESGYTVISLDARRHGERGDANFGPQELLKRAHSDEPRLYTETIIGSVRDYRLLLNWAKTELQSEEILVMGYSMGAQMSLLLASYEPSIDRVLAMVPPYVGSPISPVTPRAHVQRIATADVLWLAGTKDPYSDKQQTEQAFNSISSRSKNITWFEAGHRLPTEYVTSALAFFESSSVEGE